MKSVKYEYIPALRGHLATQYCYCGPSWACVGLRWPSLATVGFRGPALAFVGCWVTKIK